MNNHNYHCMISRRTKAGKIQSMYNSMIERSKLRGHTKPEFTPQEFASWLTTTCFSDLFFNWAGSGFLRSLSPSVDRLDNSLGYTFDNMQIVIKYYNDKKEAQAKSKKVIQLKLSGEFQALHTSTFAAATAVNGHQSNIVNCCNGKRKTAYNYKWRYKNENT